MEPAGLGAYGFGEGVDEGVGLVVVDAFELVDAFEGEGGVHELPGVVGRDSPRPRPGVDGGEFNVALLFEVDLPVPDGGHFGSGVARNHEGTASRDWLTVASSVAAMSVRHWESWKVT